MKKEKKQVINDILIIISIFLVSVIVYQYTVITGLDNDNVSLQNEITQFKNNIKTYEREIVDYKETIASLEESRDYYYDLYYEIQEKYTSLTSTFDYSIDLIPVYSVDDILNIQFIMFDRINSTTEVLIEFDNINDINQVYDLVNKLKINTEAYPNDAYYILDIILHSDDVVSYNFSYYGVQMYIEEEDRYIVFDDENNQLFKFLHDKYESNNR